MESSMGQNYVPAHHPGRSTNAPIRSATPTRDATSRAPRTTSAIGPETSSPHHASGDSTIVTTAHDRMRNATARLRNDTPPAGTCSRGST
jgi:hypothetical protein